MNTLDAVNLILRKIGEIPVTSVDEQYPTLAVALPALDESRTVILSEGYWFNTFYQHTLVQQVDGTVKTPENCLKFFPDDPQYTFVGNGIRLQSTGSPFINADVVGRLIIDLPFDNLPEMAQYAIAYHAAADTYQGDIGPDATWQSLVAKRDEYIGQIGGDHTISRQHNSRSRKQFARLRQQLRT